MVKIHFETLTSGMKAKLDARYRRQSQYESGIRRLYGSGSSSGILDDAVGKRLQAVSKRNK